MPLLKLKEELQFHNKAALDNTRFIMVTLQLLSAKKTHLFKLNKKSTADLWLNPLPIGCFLAYM